MDNWAVRVEQILAAVRRESRILLALGVGSYLVVSTVVIWLLGDRPITALIVMGYFQLMVTFMCCDRIYRCIKGGFDVNVASTMETMPVFERLNTSAEKIGKIADRIETKVEGGIIERLEGHLVAIRKRVERETEPVPVNRRGGGGDGEVGQD